VLEHAMPQALLETAMAPLIAGDRCGAAGLFAEATGLLEATVLRVFADHEGEALVVLLKALGLGRSRFDEVLNRLRAAEGLIRADRPAAELKAVFDALSFTKARVLLVYWDWFTRRAGPYAAVGGAGLVEAAPLA
jgi:hypothetical protein